MNTIKVISDENYYFDIHLLNGYQQTIVCDEKNEDDMNYLFFTKDNLNQPFAQIRKDSVRSIEVKDMLFGGGRG